MTFRDRFRPVLSTGLLIALLMGGCAGAGPNSSSANGRAMGDLPSVRQGPPVARSDGGLEIVVFGTTAGSSRFAEVLGAYVDRPVPLSRELESLWNEHGVRIVSVPLEDVPTIIDGLQGSGNAVGARERQWLGQAYSWTEAIRGPAIARPTTVALDSERILLESGALRLLIRGWLEPLPPPVGLPVGAMSPGAALGGSSSSPSQMPQEPLAVLRVEFVPQHLEAAARASDRPFAAPTKSTLDPITQGLVFTRLYTKAQLAQDRALLVFAERPGASWAELAKRSAIPESAPQPSATAPTTLTTTPRPKPADRPRRETFATDRPWGEPSGSAKPSTRPGSETVPKRSATPRSAPGVGQVIRGERDLAGEASPSIPEPPRDEEATAASIGPSVPRVPAMGEAMLSSVRRTIDDRSPTVRERAVIVLIPHVPSSFRLAP